MDLKRRLRGLQDRFSSPQRHLSTSSHQNNSDIVIACLLSECCYKAVDLGPQAALDALNSLSLQFPSSLSTSSLKSVAFCRPSIHQHYMVAESQTTFFVAIVGTKQLRDIITDINFLQNTVPTGTPFSSSRPIYTNTSTAAAAHAGFMSRSMHLASIESLYLQAHSKGLKFVICGHSLGGAVATLCLLRLLENFSSSQAAAEVQQQHTIGNANSRSRQWPIQAICFGTPAIANLQLAQYINNHGWDDYFQYCNTPEDPVPRLFLSKTTTTTTTSERSDDIPIPSATNDIDSSSTEAQDTRTLERLASQELQQQGASAITTTTNNNNNNNNKRRGLPNLLSTTAIPLPSFTHFGRVHYLASAGNGVSLPSTSTSSGSSSSVRQGWFAAHRMKLYRERLALCVSTTTTTAEHTPTDHLSGGGTAVLDASLVPLPAINKAEMKLPILQTDEHSLVDSYKKKKKRHKVHVVLRGGEGLEFITHISLCFPPITNAATGTEDLKIKAVQIDDAQVKEQLAIRLASALGEGNTKKRRRGHKNGSVSPQHMVATFLVPTPTLLSMKHMSSSRGDGDDTQMMISLEVCTDFSLLQQIPITLHAQTAWIVGNKELSGALVHQLRQRADTTLQQAAIEADAAGSSAFSSSAAAKLISKAYKGRPVVLKRKGNFPPSEQPNIGQQTKEQEASAKGPKLDVATTPSWVSWLKRWRSQATKTTTAATTRGSLAPSMLFNGVAIFDMSVHFNDSDSLDNIKTATKVLVQYKQRRKKKGRGGEEEYIDPYDPLPDQRDETSFLLGSEEGGERIWGLRDFFLLRKFLYIAAADGSGSGGSGLPTPPPDIILSVVNHTEVIASTDNNNPKEVAALLHGIKQLNHAVLAVQAIPLLVVVTPSVDLVVNAAERRRLGSMTHLVTVAGGVVPVVGESCSMVETALWTYARSRSMAHSRL